MHGYGQLAVDFLEDCVPLLQEETVLVAPEGLSRFYHRGGRGSIGASWMTSEDRLREIDDYILYLNAVWREIIARIGSTPRLSILGFSQGGATAMRWGLRGEARPERIVLWGAGFPSTELGEYREQVAGCNLVLVRGEKDRVVSGEVIEQTFYKLKEIARNVQLLEHGGGHELDRSLLSALADELSLTM